MLHDACAITFTELLQSNFDLSDRNLITDWCFPLWIRQAALAIQRQLLKLWKTDTNLSLCGN